MDIFIIKVKDADEVHRDLLKEFQKKEISNPRAWNVHCLSYLMVDRILKEVYEIENREIVFDNKKPVLKSGEKCFSISHSGEYIALGFSDYNCGIDIEGAKGKRDWRAIAERMGFHSQTEDDFYNDWTKYEAEYKSGAKNNSIKTFVLDNYVLTAVSENSNEEFELYLQN